MDAAQLDRNRTAQVQLYGEPLEVTFRRLMTAFGLTQARLAGVVGLSPPMLSQLMSAQRVKIGNPSVVSRLQALSELAARVFAGQVPPETVEPLLTEIQNSEATLTTRTQPVAPPGMSSGALPGQTPEQAEAIASAGVVARVLNTVSTPDELAAAAGTLAHPYPALAEVLRVYGFGSQQDAVAHFAAHCQDGSRPQ